MIEWWKGWDSNLGYIDAYCMNVGVSLEQRMPVRRKRRAS